MTEGRAPVIQANQYDYEYKSYTNSKTYSYSI